MSLLDLLSSIFDLRSSIFGLQSSLPALLLVAAKDFADLIVAQPLAVRTSLFQLACARSAAEEPQCPISRFFDFAPPVFKKYFDRRAAFQQPHDLAVRDPGAEGVRNLIADPIAGISGFA